MPGFVDDFLAATENMASPYMFRKWCGIAAVSGAMSKRVWTCIEDDLPLYPNMFVFLVSGPGLGKSRPVDVVNKLLRGLKGFDGKPLVEFGPDQVTQEKLMVRLDETFKKETPDGMHSFFCLISEFGTFMPEPNIVMMQSLSRIWDCPGLYEKGTKTSGDDFLYNPYLCILAGVQPSWFEKGFPKNSYEMGLPARIVFVYEDKKPHRKLFRGRKSVLGFDDLQAKLKAISRAKGEVQWTPEAKAEFNKLYEGGFPPEPDDPLLGGYTTRRDMHAGKLVLIAAVSRQPKDTVIEVEDVKTGMAWMLEAEVRMPEALSAAGGNVYRLKEEAVLGFVRAEYAKDKKYVHEKWIRKRLGQMVSTTMVGPILDELIRQQRLKVLATSVEPNRLLKPGDA